MSKEHEVWSRGNGDEPIFVAAFKDKSAARAFVKRLQHGQRAHGAHVYSYDVRSTKRSKRRTRRRHRP